jgi:hypothetical protein
VSTFLGAAKLILHPILWALVGLYWGHHVGYSRGVHAITELVLELRTVDEPPAPFSKGNI